MATPKSVSFHTLGCKLNFSETSSIRQQFESEGYAVQDFDQPSDIFVINTCSVTDFADRKCRQIVRRALRHNPDAIVVVTGCYAQLKPKEIAEMTGVDLVLGAGEKFNILSYLENLDKAPGKGMIRAGEIESVNHFTQSFSFGDRTRSFLKVQDGCDYSCSFCTIPKARGRSRSDTVENVVENARQLAAKGIKEIVLTGVNIGDFGKGTELPEDNSKKKEASFLDLITELDEVEGIERFRISSIEPNLCSDEIIEFVATSKRFAPHFHIPLQSGNNKQLRLMRRRYKRELYAGRVERIRELMPHACIGVDAIVGFPGETEEDFEESYRFIHGLDISYLHVFTYSERPGTPAAEMEEQVDMGVRKQRNKRLRMLSAKKKAEFYRRHQGQQLPVLLESSSEKGFLHGFTDNYIKVRLPEERFEENQMIIAEIGPMDKYRICDARPILQPV